MSTILPVNDEFIEEIAKAIGRERLYRDAADLLLNTLGINMKVDDPVLEKKFDKEFEILWAGKDDECIWNRENYIADARVAVNKINLLLLTLT